MNPKINRTQPTHGTYPQYSLAPTPIKPKRKRAGCILAFIVVVLLGVSVLAAYLFYPAQTNLLILGIDRAPEDTAIGRSDTNLLLHADITPGEVYALSIPRDLWVIIPGYGENRINAAHYFGELEQAGLGPRLAMDTIKANFGIQVDHFLRIQLENFPVLVDAMGGIDLNLPTPMAGLEAGTHHLDGKQALAFVRSRQGSDDFFRMEHGQILVEAMIQNLLSPAKWKYLPAFLRNISQVIDTNIPKAQMPRLILALLRASTRDTLQFESIGRDLVTPWVTPAGAQVLLPDQALILPIMQKHFGK